MQKEGKTEQGELAYQVYLSLKGALNLSRASNVSRWRLPPGKVWRHLSGGKEAIHQHISCEMRYPENREEVVLDSVRRTSSSARLLDENMRNSSTEGARWAAALRAELCPASLFRYFGPEPVRTHSGLTPRRRKSDTSQSDGTELRRFASDTADCLIPSNSASSSCVRHCVASNTRINELFSSLVTVLIVNSLTDEENINIRLSICTIVLSLASPSRGKGMINEKPS